MTGPLSTTLDAIMLAIQTQLVTWLRWPAERVLLVDPAKLSFHPEAEQYLCLWPDLESPDRPVFEGAGRLDVRLTERFFVNVRSRTALDEAASSKVWLTDSALGHVQAARQLVWDALVGQLLFDGNNNQLSNGPVVPVNGGRPRLESDEKEWGESSLAFDVQYILKLTMPPY